MSEPRKQGATGVWAASILAGLVLIPVLYFLSLGPVVWTFSRIEDTVPEWLETSIGFYFVPAQIVFGNSPEPVREALEGYVGLFEGK